MSSARVSIEDAWAIMADGLQILRYYLHAQLFLEQRAAQGEAAPPPAYTPNRIALVEGVDAALIEQALELACAAGLDYFVPMVVDRIVAERGVLRCGGAFHEPHGTVAVSRRCELDCALELLTGAAEQWLWLWLSCRQQTAQLDCRQWSHPWASDAEDAESTGLALFAASVRHRFLRALQSARPATEPERVRTLIEDEETKLNACRDFSYELMESFADLNTFDLLCLWYPGPRRFEKFQRGGGAGQAE